MFGLPIVFGIVLTDLRLSFTFYDSIFWHFQQHLLPLTHDCSRKSRKNIIYFDYTNFTIQTNLLAHFQTGLLFTYENKL